MAISMLKNAFPSWRYSFLPLALFLCDLKAYLSWMSLGGQLPALKNVGGLVVFFAFLSLMWKNGCSNYARVFGRHHTRIRFVFSNIKANLPIVVPWLILTFFYDLVGHIPSSELKGFLQSSGGDYTFFVVFLLFVVMFFPPIVRHLWGCKKIPDGPLREHLKEFCAKQGFSTEFYFWPLFEGRVITAGVMGIIPGLRYILITPALIENMSMDEVDAVVAHEIGHVKNKHLLLYVVLISGFTLLAGFIGELLANYVASREILYTFLYRFNISVDSVMAITVGLPLLLLALLYFRFVFGFFLRNFERQADLHVFLAIGNSRTLVAAFEKIAVLSGNTRDEPSWHHFGIGERVGYLEKCEQSRSWISHQNRKIKWSLIGYVVIGIVSVIGIKQFPLAELKMESEWLADNATIKQKYQLEMRKFEWLYQKGRGLLQHKKEARALMYFEKALILSSSDARILNALAWLLLTSEELELRNPLRALTLARTAAIVYPSGHILDTLATAYWANGFVEEAQATELQAIQSDPSLADYYRAQSKRFAEVTYRESYHDPVPDEVQNQANINTEEGNG